MNKFKPQQLADELAAELHNFVQLKSLIIETQSRTAGREPDMFELYAIGGILDDLYHFAESICLRIVKTVDQIEPRGASWHRDLLEQVSQPVPNLRPAILKPETRAALDLYRTFRHRFRNLYGFSLDWQKMVPLVKEAIPTIEAFVQDIEQFVAFLGMIAGSHTGPD